MNYLTNILSFWKVIPNDILKHEQAKKKKKSQII